MDVIIKNNKMLQVGDQFDQYQIQEHLAQGGMSDIYRAFDLVNRREVTLKIPDASMIGDPAQYERFQRELKVINTLNHPAILRGLGSGKYNRIPYLATEFVHGQSLREVITNQAPFPLEEAIALVRKIADGMAYCHQNNVIHRDLKPENILITSDGQPVVMDFGLALTKDAHRVTYSNLSATMGTPDYMAPEQIEGQRGDQRTDIYALGTIFYELLAGDTPFIGDNQTAILSQHLNGVAPRLDRVNPGVTPEIAAIIAQCLARQPNERFANMNVLIEAIDHPENVDLSILSKLDAPPNKRRSFLHSLTFKVLGMALVLLTVIAIVAFTLQAIK